MTCNGSPFPSQNWISIKKGGILDVIVGTIVIIIQVAVTVSIGTWCTVIGVSGCSVIIIVVVICGVTVEIFTIRTKLLYVFTRRTSWLPKLNKVKKIGRKREKVQISNVWWCKNNEWESKKKIGATRGRWISELYLFAKEKVMHKEKEGKRKALRKSISLE